ncbi:MAG: alpha/beta hydrolase [bacterium]
MSDIERQLRLHGETPFRVMVVHGGPGAAGEMAPVAQVLVSGNAGPAAGTGVSGVLEPLQTAPTLAGQVEELRAILLTHGQPPLTVIGFSWGAWLSFLLASQFPELVAKLILVGSGPFEEQYVAAISDTRRQRLDVAEREEFDTILADLERVAPERTDPDLRTKLINHLGILANKADQYDPVADPATNAFPVEIRGELFAAWPEGAALRKSGELLAAGEQIGCPVLAIHGEYDPHPAAGVSQPLVRVIEDFRFVLLPACGHKPWIERQAREAFYRLLAAELP